VTTAADITVELGRLRAEWDANRTNPHHQDKADWVRGVAFGIREAMPIANCRNAFARLEELGKAWGQKQRTDPNFINRGEYLRGVDYGIKQVMRVLNDHAAPELSLRG
jgi:hypothetical protein